MLHEANLVVAAKVADQLQERKISLEAKEGTPVGLVTSALGSWAGRAELMPNQYSEVMVHEASTIGAGNGTVPLHDEKVEWAVELIAKGVSRDLDIAKNTISPSIQRVSDEVEEEVSKAFSSAAHGFELITTDLPKIFLDQRIDNLFSRYSMIKPGTVSTMLVFPELSIAELRRRVNTGDDEINKLIAEIADGEDFELLVQMYNLYFVKATGSSNMDLVSLSNDSKSVVNLLLMYFLTIGLEADLPDGVNGSFGVVTDYLKTIRGHLGAAVYRHMRGIERAIEEKRLITTVTGFGTERKVHLNSAVYNSFMDAGGTPEAIFGAVVSDHSFDFNAMVDNRLKLERIWERRLDAIHSQNNANKLTLIVSALRKSIFGIIGDMEAIPFGAGTKADMINRVRNETENFYLADMDDLHKSIKTIVLKSLYPQQTNAGFIINGIDKYNGELAEEDALQKVAADVTLQLIAQWLVKNVTVGVANG